jgi:hypothetical protein
MALRVAGAPLASPPRPSPGPQEPAGVGWGAGRAWPPTGPGYGAGGNALSVPKWCPRDRDREEGRPEPGRALGLGWVISVTPSTSHHGGSLECAPSPWQ